MQVGPHPESNRGRLKGLWRRHEQWSRKHRLLSFACSWTSGWITVSSLNSWSRHKLDFNVGCLMGGLIGLYLASLLVGPKTDEQTRVNEP